MVGQDTRPRRFANAPTAPVAADAMRGKFARRWRLAQASVALLLATTALNGHAQALEVDHALRVGQTAPGFILPSVAAEQPPIALADYRGKVVYLDFWSSWCEPCRRAMPELMALRALWPRERFEILALNQDTSRRDALRFLEQVPVGYPVALDLGGGVARRYGVAALPAAVVIDADGVVRHILKGPQTQDFAFISKVIAGLVGG